MPNIVTVHDLNKFVRLLFQGSVVILLEAGLLKHVLDLIPIYLLLFADYVRQFDFAVVEDAGGLRIHIFLHLLDILFKPLSVALVYVVHNVPLINLRDHTVVLKVLVLLVGIDVVIGKHHSVVRDLLLSCGFVQDGKVSAGLPRSC